MPNVEWKPVEVISNTDIRKKPPAERLTDTYIEWQTQLLSDSEEKMPWFWGRSARYH